MLFFIILLKKIVSKTQIPTSEQFQQITSNLSTHVNKRFLTSEVSTFYAMLFITTFIPDSWKRCTAHTRSCSLIESTMISVNELPLVLDSRANFSNEDVRLTSHVGCCRSHLMTGAAVAVTGLDATRY